MPKLNFVCGGTLTDAGALVAVGEETVAPGVAVGRRVAVRVGVAVKDGSGVAVTVAVAVAVALGFVVAVAVGR